MLAAAVRTEYEDPHIRQPARHRGRNRRPAKANGFEVRHVFGRAVGVVQQAGDEVRRSATDRKTFGLNEFEHVSRVPHITQIDRRALEYRDQERTDHADEVPDWRCGQLASTVGRVILQQLAGLEAECLMAVHDPLGLTGGAGRERDQCRGAGIGVDLACHRLVVEQILEAVLHQADDRHVRTQVRLELHPPELPGGDEHLRPCGGQYVAQFLAPVEVHDRHHHRTDERRRPERRRGFHPVGQLNRHHIAGTDTTLTQTGGQPAGSQLDVGEGAREGADGGVHPETSMRIGAQPAGQQLTEGVGRPPAFFFVLFRQLNRHVSHRWRCYSP